MSKKTNPGSILIRLGLLGLLAAGGVWGYQRYGQAGNTSEIVSRGLGKIQGVTAALNIDSSKILETANQKLVESQPIIAEEAESASQEVLGQSTSNLTDSAKKLAEEAVTKVTDQLKDLPKQEAAKIIRTTCDQIIKDLEK